MSDDLLTASAKLIIASRRVVRTSPALWSSEHGRAVDALRECIAEAEAVATATAEDLRGHVARREARGEVTPERLAQLLAVEHAAINACMGWTNDCDFDDLEELMASLGKSLGGSDPAPQAEEAPAHASGAHQILSERQRQLEVEGYGAEHDAQNVNGELAQAAAAYALGSEVSHIHFARTVGPKVSLDNLVEIWPATWAPHYDKRGQHPRLRQLVIAGALIAAEIDRLQARGEGGEVPQAEEPPGPGIADVEALARRAEEQADAPPAEEPEADTARQELLAGARAHLHEALATRNHSPATAAFELTQAVFRIIQHLEGGAGGEAERLRREGAETDAPILEGLEECYRLLCEANEGTEVWRDPRNVYVAVAALHRAVVGMYGVDLPTFEPLPAEGGAT
jgi:hypothetical protein